MMGAWGYALTENDTAMDAALLLSRKPAGVQRRNLAAQMLQAQIKLQARLKEGPIWRRATKAELDELAYSNPLWGKRAAKARLEVREQIMRDGVRETGFDEAVMAFTVVALLCDAIDHASMAKPCPVPKESDCRLVPTKTLARLAIKCLPSIMENSVVRAEYGRRWKKLQSLMEGILVRYARIP